MSSSNIPLIHRLRANWPTKLWLGTVLTILYCAGYFAIEYHPFRPSIRLPLTMIDRSVPFQPKWIWVYQSIYMLLPVVWLSETLGQLRRYTIGFILLASAGFICFVVWPVAGPRPVERPTDPMYRALVRYDRPLNSFPSMHMALATYSACVAVAVAAGRLRRILVLSLPVWIVLIGYSTLATKQHCWMDLPPGILMGWLAQYFAWRCVAPGSPARSAALVESEAK